MKLAIYLLLLTCLTACDKVCEKGSGSLTGKWELRRVQSGMLPTIDQVSGNGNIIEFSNNTYQIFADGQVKESGTYSVSNDATVKAEVCLEIAPGEFTQRINFTGNKSTQKIFFQVSGRKLVLLSGCFALDGGSRKEYEKIN